MDRNTSSSSPRAVDISVIVPTYAEAENMEALIDRVEGVRNQHSLDLELLILDDPSGDGIESVIARLDRPWVQLHSRSGPRGLSEAVVEGLSLASGERLLVMDADLSHPPESIPALLEPLRDPEVDFVLGSRYVPGAATDEDWGLLRRLNSWGATLLARPFTSARDPMAGFFAIRRRTYEAADRLDPIGYKIGLELMVKSNCRHVVEVPIRFSQRFKGESKLRLSEHIRYLRHLSRLFRHKFLRRR